MAWQLIYTSAPRLIEAGRTGFGTVARHHAINSLLASSVERFSQFARLPGHDPRRIIHTHRILPGGAVPYHVLSCLQDAGSDYTGRTNHIAHHLIAEPREVRALFNTGLTPANVLQEMAWRTTWSEGPRYLEPAEEVDLSSFAASSSQAWAAVTGNPASADILWSREALKGCYLITPPDISVLKLYQEALQAEPGQAWQTCFTTCLEPNDDVADFRWVALTSSSPLRGQLETSNRLVLDLTHPATLPAPPERKLNASVVEIARPKVPESAFAKLSAVQDPMPSLDAVPSSVGTMGVWSPAPRPKASKPRTSVTGIALVFAAVFVVVVLGGLMQQNSHQRQTRMTYEEEIAKTWANYRLILQDTRKLLEDQSDLVEGRALLKSHEEFFLSMRHLIHTPGTPVELTLPANNQDDLKDFKKRLDEWEGLHENPWGNLQSSTESANALSIQAAFRKWQESRSIKWHQLTQYLSLNDLPPAGDAMVQTLKVKAKDLLRHASRVEGPLTNWEQLFALPEHLKSNMDPEVQQWLKLWAELDDPDGCADAKKQEASADPSLPEWLRAKAATLLQRRDKEYEHRMSELNRLPGDQRAHEVQKQLATIEDADAIAAGNDIYIRLLNPNENPAGKITGLPVAPHMQLYVGGAWDAHPRPDGKTAIPDGGLKKWVSADEDTNTELRFGPNVVAALNQMILFSKDGTLISLPEEYIKSPDGVRIVARSKDTVRVLFDLRLVPINSVAARPILTQVIESTVDNAGTVTLRLPAGLLTRLRLLGLPKPVYELRRDGSASEQKLYRLISAGDSSFEVFPSQAQTPPAPVIQETSRQISALKAGILKDESDLAENEKKKLTARQKESNRENYTNAKAAKEIRLQRLLATLQSLEVQTPLHFKLQPGKHTLMLEQPNKLELCRLNVVPAARQSR